MITPTRFAWTAHVQGLDPEQHPHLIAYIAEHRRWPSWREQDGNVRPLTSGDGWAARLFTAADGDLRAVRLSMTPATADGLNALPPDKVLGVLRRIITAPSKFTPSLGALTPEWSARGNWHWHGLLSIPDAERLEDLPHHLGRFHVHPRPVVTLRQLRRAVAYQNKWVRHNAPVADQARHAERLLSILSAMNRTRLPSMTVRFGV